MDKLTARDRAEENFRKLAALFPGAVTETVTGSGGTPAVRRTLNAGALAREIGAQLVDGFDRGELKEIYLIYTDMESAMSFQARAVRLLPFHRTYFADNPKAEEPVASPFEFLPNARAVLNSMMPSYISGFIYSALIDSFCCEQNARMTAMDSANQNAEKLLGELSLEFNRVRQAAITQEITEVSAGAKAQRQKKGR